MKVWLSKIGSEHNVCYTPDGLFWLNLYVYKFCNVKAKCKKKNQIQVFLKVNIFIAYFVSWHKKIANTVECYFQHAKKVLFNLLELHVLF